MLKELRERYYVNRITCTDDIDAAIIEIRPCLLCFDFDTPNDTGLNLLQQTKAHHPSLPIVMFTAQHSESLAIWALRSRVWDYFVKPVIVADVCSNLRPLTQRSRHTSEIHNTPVPHCPLPEYISPRSKKKLTTPALSYIEKTFPVRITLEQAASLCHVSIWTFSRVFHREHGCTFRRYLLDYRIAKAKERLSNSSASISEIAYSVGFNDLSYFSRAFRRLTGMCPSDYRPEPNADQPAQSAKTQSRRLMDSRPTTRGTRTAK